jgi:hypothetical protein
MSLQCNKELARKALEFWSTRNVRFLPEIFAPDKHNHFLATIPSYRRASPSDRPRREILVPLEMKALLLNTLLGISNNIRTGRRRGGGSHE